MLHRILIVLAALAVLALVTRPVAPSPIGAQTLAELTRTPEATADAFLRSVRAIRWSVTARLLHPQTLDCFHTLVSMAAEADSTGEAARFRR